MFPGQPCHCNARCDIFVMVGPQQGVIQQHGIDPQLCGRGVRRYAFNPEPQDIRQSVPRMGRCGDNRCGRLRFRPVPQIGRAGGGGHDEPGQIGNRVEG